MARPKRINAKNMVIGLRLTNAEVEKLKALTVGKTLSQSARDLLLQGMKNEQKDLDGWRELTSQIRNADLSKISEKLDKAMETLETLKPKPRAGKTTAERLEEKLGELSLDISDVYEAAITLLERNDRAGTNFAESFRAKRRKIRQEKESKDE